MVTGSIQIGVSFDNQISSLLSSIGDSYILCGFWISEDCFHDLDMLVGRVFYKWLTTDVVKAMSGLVSTIKNINEPTIPWYFLRSLSEASLPLSFGTSCRDSFIGVFIGFAWSRKNFYKTFSM